MSAAFLLPFLLHAGLIVLLYAALTAARAKAVMAGAASYGDFVRAGGDPPAAARIARNLGNQFELPTLAWFTVVLLLWANAVNGFDIAAAWLFLAGRAIHTLVQTMTDNVRLRGLVFTINFIGVLGLIAHAALVVLGR